METINAVLAPADPPPPIRRVGVGAMDVTTIVFGGRDSGRSYEHERRNGKRHRTHLVVRFDSAEEFRSDYATDLSRGGLFVKGVHNLRERERVAVDIELPESGTHQVMAEVVYVRMPDVAAIAKRDSGVGLAIVAAPPAFRAALDAYLTQLVRQGR